MFIFYHSNFSYMKKISSHNLSYTCLELMRLSQEVHYLDSFCYNTTLNIIKIYWANNIIDYVLITIQKAPTNFYTIEMCTKTELELWTDAVCRKLILGRSDWVLDKLFKLPTSYPVLWLCTHTSVYALYWRWFSNKVKTQGVDNRPFTPQFTFTQSIRPDSYRFVVGIRICIIVFLVPLTC